MSKKKETAVATTMGKAPAHIKTENNIDIPTADGGGGVPNIKLLQQLSPELDDESEKFIKGAKQGMLAVSSGEGQVLFPKGLHIIPMFVRKVWTEWVPRAKGGGFVATYDSAESAEEGKSPGNEVAMAIEYLVVSPDVEDCKVPMILSFNTPTKMKAAKTLQKNIIGYKTMTGVTYFLSGAADKNKAGQKYYVFNVEPAGYTDKATYQEIEAAKDDFRDQLSFDPEPF